MLIIGYFDTKATLLFEKSRIKMSMLCVIIILFFILTWDWKVELNLFYLDLLGTGKLFNEFLSEQVDGEREDTRNKYQK